MRETELLTLTRDRKKAIAGRTNSLFLIDLENGDQTADITIDMTDDQRYQAYPEHNDMWASAPSVTMYNIKFEDRSSSGRGVIRKQQKPEWESIWLEENDTVLCVVEKTCWEKRLTLRNTGSGRRKERDSRRRSTTRTRIISCVSALTKTCTRA